MNECWVGGARGVVWAGKWLNFEVAKRWGRVGLAVCWFLLFFRGFKVDVELSFFHLELYVFTYASYGGCGQHVAYSSFCDA